jgi:hypothetical protein
MMIPKTPTGGRASEVYVMRGLLMRFVREEGGFVSGPEWAFVATILVLAAVTAATLTCHAERDKAASERETSAAVTSRGR